MSLVKEKKITPSMFRPNTPYTITINPQEQYEKYNDRIDRVIKLVKRKLDIITFQYVLFVECSSPLSATKCRFPRIHFHGVIHFENVNQIKRWYNEDYFKLDDLGYFEIDTLQDPEIWYKYITKEQDIMKAIAKKSVISSLRCYKFNGPLGDEQAPNGN